MSTDSGIRIPLATVLHTVEIFHTLGEEERQAIASRLDRRRFRVGEPVFREGDPSDGLYVVHSGEVAIVAEGAGKRRVLARLGAGECFGEMSLLTGEPRSTSVYATIDADLLFLGETAFEDLIRRYPAVALAIGRTLSLRLRRANLAPREESQSRIILCVSTAAAVDAERFAAGVAAALAACRNQGVLVIRLGPGAPVQGATQAARDLRHALRAGETPDLLPFTAPLADGVRILAVSPDPGDRDPRVLGPLLGAALAQFGGAVAAAEGAGERGEEPSIIAPFTDEALRQSDTVLALVDGSAPSVERARTILSKLAAPHPEGASPVRVVLARGATIAAGSVAAIEDRLRARVVHQVRLSVDARGLEAAGLMAVARRLSRRGLGVALGGGGARGLAHIGVLDVFAAEGIPIDVIGGTSIGSIIAALHAVSNCAADVASIFRREWVDRNPLNDFTLPKSAFIRGRRGERVLRRVLGELHIEDLERPYFAVAADLVTAEEVVLDRGPLWLAVRASGSIPVLLNPVKIDRRFLVDGGVINNVPGDHLGRHGADISIAIDVSPRREPYFEKLLDRPAKAGWLGRLARRSGLLTELLDYPSLLRTLRRVIAIEGYEIMKTKSAAFDLCIQPPVEGFDLLDFSRIDRLMDAGREAAMKALPEIRRRLEGASTPSRRPL